VILKSAKPADDLGQLNLGQTWLKH